MLFPSVFRNDFFDDFNDFMDFPMNSQKVDKTGVCVAGEWHTVTSASCTTPGSEQQCCIYCSAVLATREIPAGHKPGGWVLVGQPTCQSTGAEFIFCTVCGEDLDSRSVPTVGHSYSGGACVFCGTAEPTPPPTE